MPTFESLVPRRQWVSVVLKAFVLSAAICFYGLIALKDPGRLICFIIFVCASVSSIAGFAFSALSGALLFHVVKDPVTGVKIMLIASISLQAYSVWALRRFIMARELMPYFAGGISTAVPGVYLLLNTPTTMYLLALGGFLTAYGTFSLLRPPLHLQSNRLAGRVLVGALGGITGATAAFPGAFVTIWCAAHGWEKQHQRAIYQPFILGMQILILGILAVSTPRSEMRLDLLQYVVPAMLGSYLGLGAFSLLSTAQFNKLISAFLLTSGVAMSLKAL